MKDGLPYNPDELPPNLKELHAKATHLIDRLSPILEELQGGVADYMRLKSMKDKNIDGDEFDNAYMPILNFQSGHKPTVCAFEVRDGGSQDGKRIVALCALLPDGKTVMPVLQVADFDLIEQAEYVGSDEIEILLPEDSVGIGWQKTIHETVEKYKAIHGGE